MTALKYVWRAAISVAVATLICAAIISVRRATSAAEAADKARLVAIQTAKELALVKESLARIERHF